MSHATKIGGLTANGVVEPVCETMVFPFRDVVYCKAANVDLDFGKLDGLQIDSEISSRPNGPTINRELVQWKDGDATDSVAAALEDLEVVNTFVYYVCIRLLRMHICNLGILYVCSSFFYPLKTSENQMLSVIFRGCRNETLA